MGEHRDNEPDLDPDFPIASVSLGAERPFVLKHRDAGKPKPYRKTIPKGNFNLHLFHFKSSYLFMVTESSMLRNLKNM